MTTLTLIVVGVLLIGALSGEGYRRVLAVGAATPVGAALAFGDVAVPTFYFAALGVLVALALRTVGRLRSTEWTPSNDFPGAVPLIGFACWTILLTLAGPAIFAGTPVMALGESPPPLEPGPPTTSQIAQMAYLLLSVAVVFYLAGLRTPDPHLLGLALTLVTLLSFWKFLGQYAGIPFPVGFFDNSPAFRYIDAAPGGAPRFRGVFSEPAALATSSLVTVAYMLSRARLTRGLKRIGVLSVAAMAATLASVSTSGTLVVAGVALAVIVCGTFVHHAFFRGRGVSTATVTLICVALAAAAWVLPTVAQIVEQTVDDKVGSDSFDERSASDIYSVELLLRTWGVGIGLGAHRPSSFVAMLIATTGLVGTTLFVVALAIILRRTVQMPEYRPVVWALIALLITKVVSGADLADPSGVLWIAIGTLAGGARRTAHRGDAGIAERGRVIELRYRAAGAEHR